MTSAVDKRNMADMTVGAREEQQDSVLCLHNRNYDNGNMRSYNGTTEI